MQERNFCYFFISVIISFFIWLSCSNGSSGSTSRTPYRSTAKVDTSTESSTTTSLSLKCWFTSPQGGADNWSNATGYETECGCFALTKLIPDSYTNVKFTADSTDTQNTWSVAEDCKTCWVADATGPNVNAWKAKVAYKTECECKAVDSCNGGNGATDTLCTKWIHSPTESNSWPTCE